MREKRGKKLYQSFLFSIFPKSSHQFSVSGRGVGIIGGGTYSVLLVCTLDSV